MFIPLTLAECNRARCDFCGERVFEIEDKTFDVKILGRNRCTFRKILKLELRCPNCNSNRLMRWNKPDDLKCFDCETLFPINKAKI